MSTFERYWNLLIWIGVSSGCVFQLYHISHQYLGYKTVTEVSIARHATIAIPKVILCLPQMLTSSEMDKVMGVNNTDAADFLSKFPGHRQMVHAVMVRDASGMTVYTSGDRKYESFRIFDRKKVCYGVTIPQLPVYAPDTLLEGDTTMLSVHFRFDLVRDLYRKFPSNKPMAILYLSPADKKFFGDQYNGILLDMSAKLLNRSVDITYKIYSTELMPRPHTTNCTDYRLTFDLESRDECQHECVLEFFRMQRNATQKVEQIAVNFVGFVDRTGNDTDNMRRRKEFIEDRFVNAGAAYFRSTCGDICRAPDCAFREFLPQIAPTSGHFRNDSFTRIAERGDRKLRLFQIVLQAPQEPETTLIARPTITLTDYLTYVSSTANFWFGFSPVLFRIKY